MWHVFFKPEYRNWRLAFCFALPTYLFLFVLFVEPFKNDKITYVWDSQGAYISHIILNFVLTAIVTIIATISLPKYYPAFFSLEKFGFPKFSILVLLGAFCIETGYFFTDYYFFHFDITFVWFALFMFRVTVSTFLFAGLPFLLFFLQLCNYVTASQRNNKKALNSQHLNILEPTFYEEKKSFNDALSPPQYPHDLAPKMLCFSDNSSRRNLEIPLDNFYYITSAQNYIEVFFQDKNAVATRQIFRNSLKAIEEEMIVNVDNSPLIRCHKAFIVNREKVVELRGPAKTAHFILEDIEAVIPVSRQKYAELGNNFRRSTIFPT